MGLTELLGDSHKDRLKSLRNVGTIFSLQGRYNEAQPLLEDTLEIQSRVLGEWHPDVGLSLWELAKVRLAQTDRAEAEPHFERALAITEKR